VTTRIRDEALARGSLGIAALEMMRAVFRQQLPRFPTISDEIDELVNSFFADKAAGFANTITTLPDDQAAHRETSKWAERWLVDRARQHPWGALRNRLEKRLERSELFTPSALKHYWRLTDGEDVDSPVTDAELREIAAGTHVELSLPTESGSVRIGRVGELEEMLRRLLHAAGRLHVTRLTGICADRFPSLLQTGDVLASSVDTDWEIIEETASADLVGEAAQKLRDEKIAGELFPLLSQEERTVIRYGDDLAALAQALGVGRSSANTARQRLRARLVELSGDTEAGRRVRLALVSLVLDASPDVPSTVSMDMEDSRAV
jgi:hypothetical protein